MFIILIYVILGAIYFVAPVKIELLIFIANIFLPDPIPYADEVAMMLITAKKLI